MKHSHIAPLYAITQFGEPPGEGKQQNDQADKYDVHVEFSSLKDMVEYHKIT